MLIKRRVVQVFLLFLIAMWLFLQFVVPPPVGGGACEFRDRVSPEKLVYVDHARCRMTCRDISAQLVARVYQQGALNCKKSSFKNGNRRYALEKRDDRGDKIRLIIEDDDGRHVVITVIRLGKRDLCDCS